MRCLVSGASGFLGRRLVAVLADSGHDVVALDQRPFPRGNTVVASITCDLIQPLAPHSVGDIDAAIHLAHLIRHPGSQPVPALQFRDQLLINLAGVFALLAGLERVGRLVYGSSVFVYPWINDERIAEDTIPAPFSLYGWEKLAGEKLLESFCSLHGLPLTILRFAQLYGPHEPHGQFITRMLRGAAAGRDVAVEGDGEDARDVIFVDDAARGIVAAIEQNASGIFNISGGQAVDLKEFAALCLESAGRDPKELKYLSRTRDLMRIAYSCKKAEQTFGFKPRTTLREGLLQVLPTVRDDEKT